MRREIVCSSEERLGVGVQDVFTFGKKGIPPDQRVVLMLNEVMNESDAPITIRGIEPLSGPDPAVAVLERLEVAPRGGAEDAVPQGSYVAYPPATTWTGARDCVYQEVRDPDGFVHCRGGAATRWL